MNWFNVGLSRIRGLIRREAVLRELMTNYASTSSWKRRQTFGGECSRQMLNARSVANCQKLIERCQRNGLSLNGRRFVAHEQG